MIEPLLKIRKGITRLLELALISAVALLVVDVVWGVFTRKVLGAQADFTEELAKILLIWVALLGSALAFETKGHLGVDFFVNLFAPQARKLMAVTVHIVVLAFTIIIFLAGGIRVVSDQLLMEQLTPALSWKMGHVYLALPVAGFFMLIFTIENLIVTLKTPAESNDDKQSMEETN